MRDPSPPPPDPEYRSALRGPATGEQTPGCLATIATMVGCVLAAALILAGLGVLGVMVLLMTGSFQLFPNK
ncbi:hypothetical protein [Streptomyces sp. NPDC008001]|uniref:hypothetical protein n=1 Tax=Streptomyces sp. NPDC008001 TaxID=3364804 RepID=UPI0036E310A9